MHKYYLRLDSDFRFDTQDLPIGLFDDIKNIRNWIEQNKKADYGNLLQITYFPDLPHEPYELRIWILEKQEQFYVKDLE